MAPLLDVRELGVHFPARDGRTGVLLPAVCGVSFSVAPREVLGLVGESGSGKSATALAIMRLLPPQAQVEGRIDFSGQPPHPVSSFPLARARGQGETRVGQPQDLLTANDEQMRRIRGARIAMIFQEPMTALNPVMRVGDQIAESVLAHAVDGRRSMVDGKGGRVSKSEAWNLAVQAMGDVRIPEAERRARDYPHQLSGGMRQRVMIAMAIVNRPQLLIADEPTTALDVTIQAQILELLEELRQKFELAMLFISHDLAVVSQVSDRVAVMYAGSIVELGGAREVFAAPAHPYTRGLVHSAPTLRTQRGRPLETIEGVVPSLTALPPGCRFEPRCGLRASECARELPPLVEVAPGRWARCPVVSADFRFQT